MDSISKPASVPRVIPKVRRSILLVEDDDAVRRSLQLLLSARGHTVRAYSSALGLAQDPAAFGCDCLVADLLMPPTDAIALLGALRDAGWKGRAILISGNLHEEWETKAQAAGFEAVLAKPISDSSLVRVVEGRPG